MNDMTRVVLGFALASAVSVAGYTLLLTQVFDPNLSFSLVQQASYGRLALLFVAMIMGTLAQAVHTHAKRGTDDVGLWQHLRTAARSNEFVSAIVISPIVFFALYSLAKEMPDNVIAVCTAFQNGFFWKVVLERAVPEPPK